MRELHLVLQFAAVISIATGVFADFNERIPKAKRRVVTFIAFLAGTILTSGSLGAYLIANGNTWTFTAGTMAFSLLITAYACALRLYDLIQYKLHEESVVASSVVKTLDKGVKILLLADNTKLPRNDLSLRIPDGLAPYCTEGLPRAYKHSELCIVLELEAGLAEEILTSVVKRVAAGGKFEPGQIIHGITNVDMMVYRSKDPDPSGPLRLIFPDANGRWPDDNRCDPIVAKQILPYEEIWNIVKADQHHS